MLIVGLSGERAVAQRQANELAAWQELFLAQGVPQERTITILTEDAVAGTRPALEVEEAQPPATRPSTTRDAILAQLREWRSSLGAQDDAVVVLIGLGTIRNNIYQFQIKGPRLSGEDLKTGLAGNARSYTIIATGPGGSALADLLAGPNRVIISATASAGEINQTQFGQLWAEAARETPQGNILEILQLTDQKVGTFYKDAELARTETALLRIGNAAPIHSPFEVPLPKALLQYWTFTATAHASCATLGAEPGA